MSTPKTNWSMIFALIVLTVLTLFEVAIGPSRQDRIHAIEQGTGCRVRSEPCFKCSQVNVAAKSSRFTDMVWLDCGGQQ